MAVTIRDRFFSLTTARTEYQFTADKYGVLKHLWYGEKTGQSMEYLLEYPDVGFSGTIYDSGDEREYSLNTIPLEYPCGGIGDFRPTAANALHPDGSCALDLRYVGHKVSKGKYSIPGLPAVYASEAEAETLEVILRDTASPLEVVLRYAVIEELDIITRSAQFRNTGDGPIILEKAASLCLDIPHGQWEWIHFQGRHNMERQPERAPLIHGVQESSSKRGTSSHQQNPSVILCSPDCTEEKGECYGALLVYSGSFQTQIELDQLHQVRLVMGLNPELFRWTLNSGDTFETPEAVMSYSAEGFSEMSHRFHRLIREHVCRGKYKLSERPILLNSWEAAYFFFDTDKLLEIARGAADMGVDMFVLDDGWFGKRDDDCSGLGDWFVNENKLPGGLERLVGEIKAMGLDFGIWFEPEMISEDSDLYRKHPDWAIRIPGRDPNLTRCQLLLDMSRKDVRDYLYERISSILKSADISYVKWDMNRSMSDWYSAQLPPERQGELPHRYVLGLYELLERLTSDFPDVLFEGCSGGGGRFDAGMLCYCPQIWCSDDTDAIERTKIQYGTSFFYPISTVGSHVSAVPNHQTGRVTPFETRAVTAMAGSFGYELDPAELTEKERRQVKDQISRFRKYRDLINNGSYYRLTDPTRDSSALWSFVSPDKSRVLVQGVMLQPIPNMNRKPCRLRGLDPKAEYRLPEGRTYTGGALMSGGILLPWPWEDYVPVELYLEKV